MLSRKNVSAICLLFAVTASVVPQTALAQTYPSRAVHIIVPFPPGGPSDTLGRIAGQKLAERLGQSVIIDNRPGGNTLIGAELVARSAADGYTLLLPIDSTLTMNQALYAKLPYDPVKSFAPISLLTRQSLLVSAHPKLGIKSLKELIAYAKANPGKINYATGAITSQVAGELLKTVAGINIVNVLYKGGAPAFQALLAGDVEMAITDTLIAIPHLKEGRVYGLATTGSQRAQALPELPTVAEQGYADYEVRYWFGLVAPARTPRPVIEKLNNETRAVLGLADVKTRLAAAGLEVNPTTPEEFAEIVKTESDRWAKVIRAAGIQLQ
jgi:tripartite-type tricarboxylate transporter receptor subunit TctC